LGLVAKNPFEPHYIYKNSAGVPEASRIVSHPPAAARRPVVFDPDAHMPRINRGMVYLGACLIAGIRLARERQVNVRVVPTSHAIDESVELAHEIYNRVFRKVPEIIPKT